MTPARARALFKKMARNFNKVGPERVLYQRT